MTVTVNALDSKIGNNFVLYGGDCVEIVKQLPSMSVDMCLFSPPFANVYTYSDSDRDMGNVRDEAEFITFYRMVARELYRVTRPGRVAVVHTKPIIRRWDAGEGPDLPAVGDGRRGGPDLAGTAHRHRVSRRVVAAMGLARVDGRAPHRNAQRRSGA